MSNQNIALLDANVIVRFLIGDGGDLYGHSRRIFEEIENNTRKVRLLDSVLAEVVYVLLEVYQVSRKDIIRSLIPIVEMRSIRMENKTVVINALEIFYQENIDFVDALLCAYNKVKGLEVISFDKQVNNFIEQ